MTVAHRRRGMSGWRACICLVGVALMGAGVCLVILRSQGPPETRADGAAGGPPGKLDLAGAEALYLAGGAYKSGQSVPEDYAQAAACFKKSADGGFVPAAYEYGLLRLYGLGVAKDRDEALSYLRRSAAGDMPEAQFLLGGQLLYETGPAGRLVGAWTTDAQGNAVFVRAANNDLEEAERWLRAAAQFHYAPAEWCLANEYISGKRLPENRAAAEVLLEDLSQAGFEPARTALAKLRGAPTSVSPTSSRAGSSAMDGIFGDLQKEQAGTATTRDNRSLDAAPSPTSRTAAGPLDGVFGDLAREEAAAPRPVPTTRP